MRLGIAQHQTRSFGHHQRVNVAHAALLQVQLFGAEGDVYILLDILGVDDDAVLAHAHLVEDLAEQEVEATKLGPQLGEINCSNYIL